MTLTADLQVEHPGFTLDVELRAGDDELVVILGPNGAGKSTLLDALAGLVPTAGHISVDGETLLDSDTGLDLAPEARPVGVVFQDGRLFPHLSLLDNVAFGLRCAGARRGPARTEAHRWLEQVGLGGRAGDSPAALSGGQAQLVALARALATNPRLLLLDEPLSALDAQVRPAVRADLRRHLASFTGTRLLITHDPVEALVLADRLIVLEGGRIVQHATPDEVRRNPRSAYAASVVGLNLWRGQGVGGRFVLDAGGDLVTAEPAADGPCLAVVAPVAIALHRERPHGSPRNVVEGVVTGIERRGDSARVQVDGALPLVAEITTGAVAELGLVAGDRAWASIKASEVTVYPAEPASQGFPRQ